MKEKRESLENDIMPRLQKNFKPEFINRLDDIITFNPLTKDVIRDIVDIQIEDYLDMVSRDKNIDIKLTKDAKDFLADVGYDPQFGARPLRRMIQKYLLDKLAMKIIEGDVKDGDKLKVDKQNDKSEFSIKQME